MTPYYLLPDQIKSALTKRLDSDRHRIKLVLDRISPSDTILDIGCVRHSLDGQKWENPPEGEFLHADLCRKAERVVGLDIVKSEAARMNEAGYEVYVGNAESFDLEEQFDVITAGELIEHLSNPGQFLDRCRTHLVKDGRLVLTTPNPRRLHMLIWYATGREHKANRQHTMWLDHFVMKELARRADFEIIDWEWYRPGYVLSTNLVYHLGINSLGAGGYVFELRPIEK